MPQWRKFVVFDSDISSVKGFVKQEKIGCSKVSESQYKQVE